MRSLNQILQITSMNLLNIPQRLGTSLVVVIGIAGVVAVLVSVLAMAQGFHHTLASTGRPDRAILLRAGSDAELSSSISRDQAQLIANLPNVAKGLDGRPLASAELLAVTDLPRKDSAESNNVPLRGVQASAFDLRGEIKIIEGRLFQPGVREVIVGKQASAQFAGLALNDTLTYRDSDWKVVGIFESGGDVHESEIWGDVETTLSAFRRQGYQSVTVQLADASAAGLSSLQTSFSADPRLSLTVFREPDYYAKQAKLLGTLINVLGYTVASFMALGAVFGALNCLYSAIASRQLEIATLRAIGFDGLPVVVSVLAEALLLASLGGLIGGALAYFYCNGTELSTLNFATFSQVAFRFRVTPELLAQGMGWALLIGLVGGLPPAWRAARLEVATVLRGL